jgi:hypothetical protein
MLDYGMTLAEIESSHYPVGMEIEVEVGNKKKGYERKTHKVVENHKHFVVLNNGLYNYCIGKPDLVYETVIRVEEVEKF